MHKNSIHTAADKYGVETKSIRKIGKKQLPELLKMADKSIKSTFIMEEKQKLMKLKIK